MESLGARFRVRKLLVDDDEQRRVHHPHHSGATPVQEWAVKLGATAFESVHGLRVDSQGTISVLASWTGMTDVAGTPLTAQDYDGWSARSCAEPRP